MLYMEYINKRSPLNNAYKQNVKHLKNITKQKIKENN